MRKWLPIAAAVLVVLLLVAAGAFWFAYRASQQVPEFYQRAMAVEPAVQQAGSDQMLQRSTALVSDAKKRALAGPCLPRSRSTAGWP